MVWKFGWYVPKFQRNILPPSSWKPWRCNNVSRNILCPSFGNHEDEGKYVYPKHDAITQKIIQFLLRSMLLNCTELILRQYIGRSIFLIGLFRWILTYITSSIACHMKAINFSEVCISSYVPTVCSLNRFWERERERERERKHWYKFDLSFV
jgi:hypothetical protein